MLTEREGQAAPHTGSLATVTATHSWKPCVCKKTRQNRHGDVSGSWDKRLTRGAPFLLCLMT